MPWMRLNPAAVVQQLRAEHGPSDEGAAEQALAHLREALLSGNFYGVALSSRFDQIVPAFTHKSLTYGFDQTDCRRAASCRPHASLR